MKFTKNIKRTIVALALSTTLLIPAGANSNAINRQGGYNQNDVRVISGLTTEQIRELLPQNMKELAPILHDVEHRPNPINAIFLSSIIRLETGNGTSYSYRARNNTGGVMGRNGLRSFSSKNECVSYMHDFLNRGYIRQNRISVWRIGSKYCVGGNWASKVNNLSKNMMYRSWNLK